MTASVCKRIVWRQQGYVWHRTTNFRLNVDACSLKTQNHLTKLRYLFLQLYTLLAIRTHFQTFSYAFALHCCCTTTIFKIPLQIVSSVKRNNNNLGIIMYHVPIPYTWTHWTTSFTCVSERKSIMKSRNV